MSAPAITVSAERAVHCVVRNYGFGLTLVEARALRDGLNQAIGETEEGAHSDVVAAAANWYAKGLQGEHVARLRSALEKAGLV